MGIATTSTITAGPRQVSDQNSQGTVLGASATDLIGFYGVAQGVAQATPTGVSTGFVANAGTAMNSLSTSTGGIGSTAYNYGDVIAILKTLGLLKS